MRARILHLVERLREHELAVSVAETIDAVAAVAVAGVDRDVLREALAATLVKDEGDRPAFDTLFDETFPLVGAPATKGRRRRAAPAGGGMGEPSGRTSGGGAAAGRPRAMPEEGEPRESRGRVSAEPPRSAGDGEHEREAERRARAARRRDLLHRPFHALTPRDVEEARDLVRELGARLRARLGRRERRQRHGRLDVRRMLRAATATGGVPLRVLRRGRRPDRPDLIALVDLSGSVAAASELLLGLVAPAAAFFRRVRTYAYVDHLCPVTIERGHLVPAGALDLYARSDFGRVLQELVAEPGGTFTRRTLLLVLGDARNNRLPPRADLLRAVRDRVQRIVWLAAEPRARWNTGDSVLARYGPACDAVLECESLGALLSALRHTL